MCKRNVILLLSLTLAGVFPSLCAAQDQGWMRNMGNAQVAQLAEEVWLLQRIDTIGLSADQLRSALELYKQYPPEIPAEQKPIIDKLTQTRQRLLTGVPLSDTELQQVFQLYRGAMQRRGRGQEQQPAPPPAPVELTALGKGLWSLLTVTQKAALLGDVRQAAANNQRFDKVAADRALKTISSLRGADDATWAASRTALSNGLSSAAGAEGSPQRENSRAMFVEFLDRLRKMPATEFAAKQDELSAELTALMPPGSSLTVAMAEVNPGQIQGALMGTLLHPRAPQLLQELLASKSEPR
ncbi:MAG: hypothetical protein ACM3VW_06640 [Bacteroidota bacterium]